MLPDISVAGCLPGSFYIFSCGCLKQAFTSFAIVDEDASILRTGDPGEFEASTRVRFGPYADKILEAYPADSHYADVAGVPHGQELPYVFKGLNLTDLPWTGVIPE